MKKIGLQKIRAAIRRFSRERDWDQFHNGKDLALALFLEAAELNELYLWKKPSIVSRARVAEELADVFNYAILIADKYGLDVGEIVMNKLKQNDAKYPVAKARGNARKYTEFKS